MKEGEIYLLHWDDDEYLVKVVSGDGVLSFQCGRKFGKVDDFEFDGSFNFAKGPLDDSGVKEILSPEYEGNVEVLAKKLGKLSWCSDCEEMTCNIPGTMYGGKPFSEKDFLPEQRYHPDYGRLMAEYREYHFGDLNWLQQNVWSLPEVPPTEEQLADRFFACAECGKEKFWDGGYNCPRCDFDRYIVLSVDEFHYNRLAAMEFGGTPMNWDEILHCTQCGLDYKVSNANY